MFVVPKERSTSWRWGDPHVLPIDSTKAVWEVPSALEFFGYFLPLLWILWHLKIIVNAYIIVVSIPALRIRKGFIIYLNTVI